MRVIVRLPAVSALALALSACGLSGGCASMCDNGRYSTPERKCRGLALVLPGIEGVSSYNRNIQRGLVNGGVDWAVEIYPWGRPIPVAGMVLNQMDFVGNRFAAQRIARYIVQYQQAHPGRPVWIVGHSGGGGMAVFIAEALPEDVQVDGLVLLAASIHNEYDLTKALVHCRRGIVNYYNPGDSALLAVGTTLTSNVDGRRGPSAGLRGFTGSYPNLRQRQVFASGDPHGAAAEPSFVRSRVAPWLRQSDELGAAQGLADFRAPAGVPTRRVGGT